MSAKHFHFLQNQLNEWNIFLPCRVCNDPLSSHPILDNIFYPDDIERGVMYACQVADLADAFEEVPDFGDLGLLQWRAETLYVCYRRRRDIKKNNDLKDRKEPIMQFNSSKLKAPNFVVKESNRYISSGIMHGYNWKEVAVPKVDLLCQLKFAFMFNKYFIWHSVSNGLHIGRIKTIWIHSFIV